MCVSQHVASNLNANNVSYSLSVFWGFFFSFYHILFPVRWMLGGLAPIGRTAASTLLSCLILCKWQLYAGERRRTVVDGDGPAGPRGPFDGVL